ncbi:MAG: hypothetical protein HOK54_19410 [Alphaproteobacteria bacterium]|nr:hypothetical protein [Alphaproteobacteria bacterium]
MPIFRPLISDDYCCDLLSGWVAIANYLGDSRKHPKWIGLRLAAIKN